MYQKRMQAAATMVAATVVLAGSAMAAGLTNGGFEGGTIDPWYVNGPAAVNYIVVADPIAPGNSVAKGIYGGTPGGLGGLIQRDFDLSPNTTYVISYRRLTEGNMWAGIWDLDHNIGESTFYEIDAGGNLSGGTQVGTVAAALNVWDTSSVTVKTAATTVKGYIHFNCHLQDENQAIYLDDFQIVPEPGSLLCLASGLGVLCGLIRRRN